MVMNNAKPRRFLVFMILNLLRTGLHVQRKTTSVETLEGTLTAGPGRWRMEDGGWRFCSIFYFPSSILAATTLNPQLSALNLCRKRHERDQLIRSHSEIKAF
jgi:hypothetical protein